MKKEGNTKKTYIEGRNFSEEKPRRGKKKKPAAGGEGTPSTYHDKKKNKFKARKRW